jgi:uncharacterized membrane protein
VISLKRTGIRHRGPAAVASAVVMLAVLALATPAGAQAAPEWSGCTAGGVPVTSPPLLGNTGDGFLLNRGAVTRIVAPGSASETVLYGINQRGQSVGGYVDADGAVKGFLLDKGVFTPIEFPGALATTPVKINARGQVVGVFSEVTDRRPLRPPYSGFLLDRGAFTRIDVPGATSTFPFGINDRGQVVGLHQDAGGTIRGFLLDKGVFTTIEVPGARASVAFDINNRGQIVGAYFTNSNHGFLLDKGVCTTIDPPGATITQPSGINNRGQVVGAYADAGGTIHGFRRDGGTFTTIDAPGASPHTVAYEIDDRGRIVGFRQTANGGTSVPSRIGDAGLRPAVP